MAIRRQEDVAAFSEFVSARSQALYRMAYVVIGDHQLALVAVLPIHRRSGDRLAIRRASGRNQG